jgi:hypothetical protein
LIIIIFFLNRCNDFEENGRVHTKEDSLIKDQEIKTLLIKNNIDFIEVNSTKKDIKKLAKDLLKIL